jgi:nucleoside-diphosphate-sugar epimerase
VKKPAEPEIKPTIVITGSDGLIGSALVRALSDQYDVVGLDNDRSSELEGLHDLIYCDLTKGDSVEQAFGELETRHGFEIASFIHLAAYYDFSGNESPLYEKLTVEGTRHVLRQLKRFQLGQFVFASTLLVMKPSQNGEAIDETSAVQAEWLYPQSKLKTEELIARERGHIPAVLLRIAGVYTDLGRAVPVVQQVKRIYEKDFESYVFPGDAGHGQSMVHLDDLVSCFAQVIAQRDALISLEKFLIGEPTVMSYEELQEQIGELIHGKEWPAIRIPKPLAKLGAQVKQGLSGEENGDFIQPWMIDLADQDYRIDITKARRLLRWEPRHKLRDTLPRIVGRLLDDPAAWYRANGLPEPSGVEAKQ